jgi:hypothetical protein
MVANINKDGFMTQHDRCLDMVLAGANGIQVA